MSEGIHRYAKRTIKQDLVELLEFKSKFQLQGAGLADFEVELGVEYDVSDVMREINGIQTQEDMECEMH